jgi:hypothetical protein
VTRLVAVISLTRKSQRLNNLDMVRSDIARPSCPPSNVFSTVKMCERHSFTLSLPLNARSAWLCKIEKGNKKLLSHLYFWCRKPPASTSKFQAAHMHNRSRSPTLSKRLANGLDFLPHLPPPNFSTCYIIELCPIACATASSQKSWLGRTAPNR